MTVTTLTPASANPWIAPAGVTSVLVQAWGEGGDGGASLHGSHSGSGAGGGEFAGDTVHTTPLSSYTWTIGSGGSGSSTVFPGDDITVTAHAGGGTGAGTTRGAGGTGSTNGTHHDGGLGGASIAGSSTSGGSGGGSGGTTGAASGITAGSGGGATGGSGGAATASGGNGNVPGSGAGGGGSGGAANHGGGSGAAGKIILTYTAVLPVPARVPRSTAAMVRASFY